MYGTWTTELSVVQPKICWKPWPSFKKRALLEGSFWTGVNQFCSFLRMMTSVITHSRVIFLSSEKVLIFLDVPLGPLPIVLSQFVGEWRKCRTSSTFSHLWKIQKWRLHSYVCALLSPSSPFLSWPALRFTLGKPLHRLTLSCLNQFQIWGVIFLG